MYKHIRRSSTRKNHCSTNPSAIVNVAQKYRSKRPASIIITIKIYFNLKLTLWVVGGIEIVVKVGAVQTDCIVVKQRDHKWYRTLIYYEICTGRQKSFCCDTATQMVPGNQNAKQSISWISYTHDFSHWPRIAFLVKKNKPVILLKKLLLK